MRGERLARGLARLLLRLYPRSFRLRDGEACVAAAAHVWRRERTRVGRVHAVLRLVRVLVADAWLSAPVEHRRARARRTDRARTRPVLDGVAGEVRLAARMLVRRPAYTALVVGTLGLAIGSSTAVYGALDRVVLRPLPYPEGDRLGYLALHDRERGWQFAPFTEVLERWRAGSRTLDGIETYRQLSMVRTGDGEAEVLRTTGVSGGLPGLLGVSPLLGRMLRPDDAASQAILLSERFWRRDRGADPSAIGATLLLNDSIFTVAGVWPDAARLDYEGAPDIFRVLPPAEEAPRGDFTLVLAKLRRGVAPDLVEAELATMLSGIEDVGENVVPVVNEPYGFLGDAYVRGLWMVFAGGLVLLVVAVINAANLVLGRSFARLGEMRIRLAMGGSRSNLLRLFFVESGLLALAGAAVGVAVMALVQHGLAMLEPGRLVPPGATGLQVRALAFACALAALAAFVCAIVPLIQLRGGALHPALASSAGGRTTMAPVRMRTVLIAGQTALAVLLVTGGALASRSLAAVLRVDTGMDIEQLAVVSLRASRPPYDDADTRRAYFDRVREALAAIPGAQGVTVAPNPPLSFSLRGGVPYLDGEAEPVAAGGEFVASTTAEPNFFAVTGVRILHGRSFEPGENDVIIVNEAFASRHGGDVLGRALRFPGDTLARTIVGVVANVSASGLAHSDRGTQLYYPRTASPATTYERFVIRTTASPAAYLARARARLAAIDRDIPLREATTGPQMIRAQTSRYRFVAFLLGGFAALGLVFAVSGVYGVVALDVHRRSREVGVRIALGASHARVATAVLRRGLAPVACGALAGAAGALWSGPLLESLLFGVSARDPLSAVAGIAIMLTVATVACLIPARRAARVDPAVTLHSE